MATQRLIPVVLVGLLFASGAMAVAAPPARVATLTDLEVNEEVDGDVVAIGGDIVLGPSAVVHGHAVSIFGEVRSQPGATVDGRVIALSSLASVSLVPVEGGQGSRLVTGVRVLAAGSWLLVTTLIAFLWPARIRRGAAILPQLGLKLLIIGVMVAVTLVAALVAVIGLGSAVGMPLAATVGVAFLCIKALGLTVMGGGLGSTLLRRLVPSRVLPVTLHVFVGVLALLMLRFMPVVGGAAWTAVVVVALGAGVFSVTMAPHRNTAAIESS
jgi:hypothetical protein